MSKRDKLIDDLRNSVKNVRFEDACKIAGMIGFTYAGGKGSHRTYQRPGETSGLNFQNRDGFIKPYQARQLLEMVNKYWDCQD